MLYGTRNSSGEKMQPLQGHKSENGFELHRQGTNENNILWQ